jgi:hypothetical protein
MPRSGLFPYRRRRGRPWEKECYPENQPSRKRRAPNQQMDPVGSPGRSSNPVAVSGRCTSVQWPARLEHVRYGKRNGQRPMPYLEKEINKLALKVALAALSISAFAGQPVKEENRDGGSRAAPSHRAGSNSSVVDNDGKRDGAASPPSKEGVHSNPSGKPIQADPIRPGAGSYNRDLLR